MMGEKREFAIQCAQALKGVSIEPVLKEAGLTIYQAQFDFGPQAGGEITLSMDFPMVGILSDFYAHNGRHSAIHQWFGRTQARSEFYFGSPFISAVRDGVDNYVTVAISDAVNESLLTLAVEDFEQQEKIRFSIKLLMGREKLHRYEVFIRVDERAQPLRRTMSEVSEWFRAFYPERGECPPASEDALYSSWYNFHQHPDGETLLREMDIAAKLGFKTLIIDDGWQYDGMGTGDYIDCGDWVVSREKFPDFKGFVRKVHDLGVKVMLWFPVPFAGFRTQAYREFRDRMLYEETGNGAGVFDVRYREVREHIVKVFAEFAREYELDGLKLDFIDSFRITDATPPANDRMDKPALSDAVIALLDELDAALKTVKPDMLLEYRQNYVGPAITRYGNMLRVGDCAFDVHTNRLGIADLRLLDYRLAVHSDMLFWAQTETDGNVARQLINVLFSVPQISVLLTEVPASHVAVVKAFLDYWTANRKTLLHGEFAVTGIHCGYPLLTARDGEKAISAVYQNTPCEYLGGRHDVFNATAQGELVVVNRAQEAQKATVVNMLGQIVEQTAIQPGANLICVPVGGRIEIE